MDGKRRNFSQVPHWIIEKGFLSVLKPSAVKVLLVLYRYADYKTRNARPTDPLIAKLAGIHISSVPSARKALKSHCLIKAWIHKRRWYYQLPFDMSLEISGAYLAASMRNGKARRKIRACPRCPKCNRFISMKKPGHLCREIPGVVVREIPRTDLETIRDSLETAAGSASALAGAKASPASHDQLTTKPKDWLKETIKEIN